MMARILYAGLFVNCLLLTALAFHLAPDNFLADDAYFYLQIARKITAGEGSTFHGVCQTNGYHPLWMLFCITGALLVQGDPHLLLHLMALVQVALFGLSSYILWQILQSQRLDFWLAGVMVLAAEMLAVGGLRLFEAHLAITLHLALFWEFIKTRQDGSRSLVGLGFLLALLFLTRLDLLFFCLALGLATGWKVWNEAISIAALQRLIPLYLPPLLLGGSYQIYNIITYGHPVPISGLIKSAFPHIQGVSLAALGIHGPRVLAIVLPLVAVAIFLAPKASPLRTILKCCLVGITGHALYIILFGRNGAGTQWAYTTAYAALPLATCLWLNAGASRFAEASPWRPRYRHAVYSGILLMTVCSTAVALLKTRRNFSVALWALGKQSIDVNVTTHPGYKVVADLNTTLAPGTRVLVFDAPGFLAYHSHLSIVPADGLVNDREYDTVLSQQGARDYLQQHQIHYYLGPWVEGDKVVRLPWLHSWKIEEQHQLELFSPIHQTSAGVFQLDQPLFTQINPNLADTQASRVALWSIR